MLPFFSFTQLHLSSNTNFASMEGDEESIKGTVGPTIIKGLASCNPSTRSKSLKSLFNYLSSQTLISDLEFKKLWKSLFYCMWHSDKIQNQTHLVNLLSNLLTSLSYPLSLSYFSHFLLTMRREWPGIDHLRLDKFYLLVRHFVRNFFVLMKDLNWDLSVLGEFVRVFEKDAFFNDNVGDNGGLGNGVSYHIVCVFFDEIKPFLPLNSRVLDLLFSPFCRVLCRSDNKVLVGKVKANVFDCLVKFGKDFLEAKKNATGDCEVDGERGEVVLFGSVALGMGFAKRFLELGSSEECLQGNRKVVFALHEDFLRLEKEMSSLGFEVSLPEVAVCDDGDDDEVPKLIPINTNNAGMDVEVGSKKNKKGSKEKKSKKKKKKKKKDENEGGSNGSVDDVEMANVSDVSNVEGGDGVNTVEIDVEMISNLQQQFEQIAADCGLYGGSESAIDSSPIIAHVKGRHTKNRKRKRSKSVENGVEEEAAPMTDDKSVKRVRFALKDNIVWKTQNPLPPQSVRIPPSSTPRGSALKKGLSPGPIRNVSSEDKKMKMKKKKKKPSPMKKAKKVKSVSPSKRVKKKKVKSMSA